MGKRAPSLPSEFATTWLVLRVRRAHKREVKHGLELFFGHEVLMMLIRQRLGFTG